MAGKACRRRSAADWRRVLAQQVGSGLSVAAFCARERLSAASFYQWRSRLREEPPGEQPTEPAVRGAFVDLGALGSSSRLELRIELGGVLVVQVARG